MSTDESTTALTRTEWTNVREQLAADPAHRRTLAEFALAGKRFDAAAAIALHEQPFGFSREDLHDLVTAITDAKHVAARGGPDGASYRRLAERLNELAGRIARLLPEGSDG